MGSRFHIVLSMGKASIPSRPREHKESRNPLVYRSAADPPGGESAGCAGLCWPNILIRSTIVTN